MLEYQNIKKCQLDFENINLDFFYKYSEFLTNRPLYTTKLKQSNPWFKNRTIKAVSVNSLSKNIQILKAMMGEAVDLKYTENLEFKRKKFSVVREETHAVCLTRDELARLYALDLSHDKKDERIRDLFVFGCGVGLRFSDYNSI